MLWSRGRIGNYLPNGIVVKYFTNDIVVNPCNHTQQQAQGTNEAPAFTTQSYQSNYTKNNPLWVFFINHRVGRFALGHLFFSDILPYGYRALSMNGSGRAKNRARARKKNIGPGFLSTEITENY